MINIPKSAVKDDSEDPATPEVGDVVNLKDVSVVIKSVTKDGYTGELQSINGEDCSDCSDDDEESTESMGNKLMKQAEETDKYGA